MKNLRLLSTLAVITLCAACSTSRPISTSVGRANIGEIRSLAGIWESTQVDPESKQKEAVVYKVISGGSAVQEILFPDSSHEMVSIYFEKGDNLRMTHYCMLNNQPELAAVQSDQNSVLFDYAGGTNVDPSKDMHIHRMKLTFVDPNHIRQDWIGYQEGKENHVKTIEFVRKQG